MTECGRTNYLTCYLPGFKPVLSAVSLSSRDSQSQTSLRDTRSACVRRGEVEAHPVSRACTLPGAYRFSTLLRCRVRGTRVHVMFNQATGLSIRAVLTRNIVFGELHSVDTVSCRCRYSCSDYRRLYRAHYAVHAALETLPVSRQDMTCPVMNLAEESDLTGQPGSFVLQRLSFKTSSLCVPGR